MKFQVLVFLGNPGKEYEKTRHNAGWIFCQSWGQDLIWQEKFKGLWCPVLINSTKLYFLKPQTFMNLSGESARALGDFFKIPGEQFVIVHDDLEVPFGEVRFQQGGGLGGHNGLRSVKQQLGTQDFFRLRLGIGRPPRGDVASFVLSRFSSDEEIQLPWVWKSAWEKIRQEIGQ